jgi:hypothetical protein
MQKTVFASGRVAIIAASLLGAASIASASIVPNAIVADQFSGANQASLDGRTPDTGTVNGNTFTATIQSASFYKPRIDTSLGNPSPTADMDFNGAAFINISSGGAYVKPTLLTISADAQLNTLVQNAGEFGRGVGVGFYSAAITSPGEAISNFRGLVLNPDGTLRLTTNLAQGTAVPNNTTSLASVSVLAPGFDKSVFYPLTYSIDTTTGALTNVNFNGTDYTAAFAPASLGVFTDANTNIAGFYASTANNAAFIGRADNFSVGSSVPEPATITLAGVAALGLLSRRRRSSH